MWNIGVKNKNTIICVWQQGTKTPRILNALFLTQDHTGAIGMLDFEVRGFESIFNSHLVFLSLPAEENGLEKVLTLGRVK